MTSYPMTEPNIEHASSSSSQFAGFVLNPALNSSYSPSYHISDFSQGPLPTNVTSNCQAVLNHPLMWTSTSLQPTFGFTQASPSTCIPASAPYSVFVPTSSASFVPAPSTNFSPAFSSASTFESSLQPVGDIDRNMPLIMTSMQVPVTMVQPVSNTALTNQHRFPVHLSGISNISNKTFKYSNSVGQTHPFYPFLPECGLLDNSFISGQHRFVNNVIHTRLTSSSNNASKSNTNRFVPYPRELQNCTYTSKPENTIPVTSNNQMYSHSLDMPFKQCSDLGSQSVYPQVDVTMDVTEVRSNNSNSFLACDTSTTKENMVSMDQDNFATQTNKMSSCKLIGDASSLVIGSVVGGIEAKNMVELGESESLSNCEMDQTEELCISGGSIQNVLVQGDQMSFITSPVQLEVVVERDMYTENTPGRCSKSVDTLTKFKTSSLCSLEYTNENKKGSSSSNRDSGPLVFSSKSTTSNAGNGCSLNGIVIKKEPPWCSADTGHVSDILCPTIPSLLEATQLDTKIQGIETERDVTVTTTSIPSDEISSMQSSLVHSVGGDSLSSTPVVTLAADSKQRHMHPESSSSSIKNARDPSRIMSNDKNTEKDKAARDIVHSITTGMDERTSPTDPLACSVCGVVMSRQQTLKRHLRSHYGYDPFTCHECNKVFSDTKQLEKHISVHKGVKPFVCIHCGKCFVLQRNHAVHLQFHIENSLKDLLCCICDKRFDVYKSLVDHLNTHTDAQLLTCKFCTKRLPTGIDMLIHTQTHDQPQLERADNFSCKICKKIFNAETDLNDHSTSHIADDIDLVASDATRATISGEGISKTTHSRTLSTKQKTWSCNICGKTFQKATDLVAHRFQHVGEQDKDRKYECEECGSKFKKSWHLKEHMRRHSGVEYYGCSVCGKTFKRSNQMTKHKKGHFTANKSELANSVCDKK